MNPGGVIRLIARAALVTLIGVTCVALWASPALAAAPDTILDSTPPASTNQTSATFTFHSDDPNATFRCSHDSGGFGTCVSPRTITGFGEGQHTFAVEAVDNGVTDPTPATDTWTVDRTPPVTTITAQPAPDTNVKQASFSFTSSEAASTFTCSLDGAAAQACTSPASYPVQDGTHTFTVQATDAAGNVETTAKTVTWLVDTVPPDTHIVYVHQQAYPLVRDPDVNFVASSTDPTVKLWQCSLNGGAFAACDIETDCSVSPCRYIVFQPVQTGHNVLRVRSVDGAGNIDPTPSSFTWTTDTTPPAAPKVVLVPVPTASTSAVEPAVPITLGGVPRVILAAPDQNLNQPTPEFTLADKLQAQWGGDATTVAYRVKAFTAVDLNDTLDWPLKFGTAFSRTKRTAAVLTAPVGRTTCIRVWAYDKAGNISASTKRCTTIPRPVAPPFPTGPGAPRIAAARAWHGYYLNLKPSGSLQIALNNLSGGYLSGGGEGAIVAETCKACGTLEISFADLNDQTDRAPEVHLTSLHLHSHSATGTFKIYRFRLPIDRQGNFAAPKLTVVGGVAHIAALGIRPTGVHLDLPGPGT